MSLSKDKGRGKHWYSNNCLHFLKRTVALNFSILQGLVIPLNVVKIYSNCNCGKFAICGQRFKHFYDRRTLIM